MGWQSQKLSERLSHKYRTSQVVLAIENRPANRDPRDVGSIPGLGRAPGGGHSNPLQYSCLENPLDRGAWRSYRPWGHKEADMTEATSHVAQSVGLTELQTDIQWRSLSCFCSLVGKGLRLLFPILN